MFGWLFVCVFHGANERVRDIYIYMSVFGYVCVHCMRAKHSDAIQ